MTQKAFSLLLALLVLFSAAIACDLTPDDDESNLDASVEQTLQANNIQLTLQAQSVQLTALSQTLAPSTMGQMPGPTALPPVQAPSQPTLPAPPTEEPVADLTPSIRTKAETPCWYVTVKKLSDNKIIDKIQAGEELEILYKKMIRKDEASPWKVEYLEVKTSRGCTCWVDVEQVEVVGDLTEIEDATWIFTTDVMFGSCP